MKPAMSDYNSDEEALTVSLSDEEDEENEDDDQLTGNAPIEISLEKADILERLQQRLHLALEKLPPLDTPEFWIVLEKPGSAQDLLIPEVLAWAVRQFAEQGNKEKTDRAFAALCLHIQKLALYLATNSLYLSSQYLNATERLEYAKDVVQKALLNLYFKLNTTSQRSFELNFKGTFGLVINSEAKSLARKEGYYQDKKLASEKDLDENKTVPGKTNRIPRQYQLSLDAPIGTNSHADGAEDLLLAEVAPDDKITDEFQVVEIVELRETLLKRLNPDEAQIFRLRYEDHLNLNEISTLLGREWKWVNRRLLSVQKIALEILDLTPEEAVKLHNSLKKKAKSREGTGK